MSPTNTSTSPSFDAQTAGTGAAETTTPVAPTEDARPLALVTGATGGMGELIVRELARTHRIVAVGRSEQGLAELTAAVGGQGIVIDFAHPETIAPALEQSQLSAVSVLVHTAAIAVPLGVHSASVPDWNTHFAVNVTSAAELTRLLLPGLREREGTVIFVGSGAGTRPVPGSAVYAATKHALRAVADTLRIDEEPHRVRVTTLAPGQTATKMSGALVNGEHPERLIQPESIAQAVRFLVDAPADVHLTDLAVRPRQEIARL